MRVYEANVSSQTDPAVQAQAGLRAGAGARHRRARCRQRSGAGRRARAGAAIRDRDAPGGAPAAPPRWCSMPRRWSATSPPRDAPSGRSERPLLLDRAHRRARRGRVRDPSPGRRRARCRRQSPRPADLAWRVPKALSLPTTGDIPADAALAAAQRLGADAVLIGYGDAVPTGGAWRWTLTRRASAKPGMARSKRACMARPTCSRAMRRRSPRCPRSPSSWKSRACRRSRTMRASRRSSAKPAACAACSSPKRPASRATFSVLTRGGADALLALARAPTRSFERMDPKAGGTIAFRFSVRRDAAPPAQLHLPGAHRADLADHRRAAGGRILDGADPGGRVRGVRRARRLAGQAVQLDLASRQDPRPARRQTTAGGAVPHRHLDQPAALVADGRGRGARRDDRLRAR